MSSCWNFLVLILSNDLTLKGDGGGIDDDDAFYNISMVLVYDLTYVYSLFIY